MTLSTVRRHLAIAIRTLVRTPGFAVGAIVTLALGIGLSTAVYTVAETLLIRPLPVRDQDRIVLLWGEKRDGGVANYPLSVDESRDFARRTRSLERVAFALYQGAWPVVVREDGQVSRLRRALVTGDFFDVLGVRAVLGRTPRPSDDVAGAAPVVVISYGVWQRRFGGATDVIGRQIVTSEASTIVGVMPQGIDYPKGTDMWAPLYATIPQRNLQYTALTPVGRLARGATLADARAELTAFHRRPEASQNERELAGSGTTLPRQILGDTRVALFAFAGAAALLLLMSCVNVANLILVRGLSRARELAVRSALGASRAAIAVQLVIENAVLAAGGGMFGVVVALLAIRVFVAVAPGGTPRVDEIHLDATVIGGAFAITFVATMFFAVVPAIVAARVDASMALRSGARAGATRRSRWTAEILVGAQLAIAMIVMSAAGLITRSLVKLERADLAFDPRTLLIAEWSVQSEQYADVEQLRLLLERMLVRLQSVPGVRAASPMPGVPYSGAGGWDGQFAIAEQTKAQAAANPLLDIGLVTPGFFETFGLPIVRGRAFTAADREGAAAAIVLSESAARHYWPGADAIGKHVLSGDPSRPPLVVVGVVPDMRYRDLREARASVYFPLRQSFFPFVPMVLAIRTTGDPATLAPAIRAAIGEVDPALSVVSAVPFESFLKGPLGQPRLNALLLGVFAGSALVLCAVGLLGVMMTMVRQRTRELGVRLALGATAGELCAMVMRRGLAIAVAGAAAGMVGALALTRGLTSMLYAVSPWDASTYLAMGVLLVAAAAIASAIPARVVSHVDPVVALRADG